MIIEQIYCIGSQKAHSVELRSQNENTIICPECSHTRKKSKDKCLGYNYDKQIGHCNHCDERFVKYKEFEIKQKYHLPKWENFTELTDKAVRWFSERMIGQRTLRDMKVSSTIAYMPQIQKETSCIAFPFYRNNSLVNVKYRDGRKNFKLEKGAERIFYNHDAIRHKELIITEGEIDTLTFINDGFNNVVSVPNGASTGNMEYLNVKELDHIDTFYIAVDNDAKGLDLRNEFIRRLGAERCKIVSFKQYKDANEYYCANGHGSLEELIKNAKQPKVEDVLTVDDFEDEIDNLFENGLQRGKTIGLDGFDELVSFELGRLLVATGTPSSGKSNFIDYINIQLNIKHGWKIGYWSPESSPNEKHYSTLASMLIGKTYSKQYTSRSEHINAKTFIKQNFYWINSDNVYDIDNILKKFEYLVKAHGVKVIVIDPYTNIVAEERDERRFVKYMLNSLTRFAKKYNVLVQLVAHPRKMEKNKDGIIPVPSMYDISGSADFWNKCDYGIAIGREYNIEDSKLESNGYVVVHKVKMRNLGSTGKFEFDYDTMNGRYRKRFSQVNSYSLIESTDPKQNMLEYDIPPYDPSNTDIPF